MNWLSVQTQITGLVTTAALQLPSWSLSLCPDRGLLSPESRHNYPDKLRPSSSIGDGTLEATDLLPSVYLHLDTF